MESDRLVRKHSETKKRLAILDDRLDEFASSMDKLADSISLHRGSLRAADEGYTVYVSGRRFDIDGETLGEHVADYQETVTRKRELEIRLREAGLENLIR